MIFWKVLGCVLFKKDSSIPWKYLQFLGGISLFLAEMFNFYYYSWPLTRISFLGLGGGWGDFCFPPMCSHQVFNGFPSSSQGVPINFWKMFPKIFQMTPTVIWYGLLKWLYKWGTYFQMATPLCFYFEECPMFQK